MTNFTFNIIKDDKFDFTPTKANASDSGYDCRAWLPDGEIILEPINILTEMLDLVEDGHTVESYFDTIAAFRKKNHVKIPLGFSINVNESFMFEDVGNMQNLRYELAFQVRMRSGNAFNAGIQGHIGTIDTLYNNQVYVMIYNTSNIPFTITHGQKVCQIVPELIPQLSHDIQIFDNIADLDGKRRGGFGESGAF